MVLFCHFASLHGKKNLVSQKKVVCLECWFLIELLHLTELFISFALRHPSRNFYDSDLCMILQSNLTPQTELRGWAYMMVQDNYKAMHENNRFRGTYFTRISFPLSYSFIEYKRSDTIQTSSGLWRSFPADLTSKSATMCVLFAVYHQDIFLEPAEGVKQAVMQHKLQFLYCAIAFVKEKNSVWPCCQCFITEMTKKMWHSYVLLVYLHVCFTQLNKAFNFNTHINTKSFWDCIH